MSVWTVGGAGVVGTLGFLGYGVGGLIGDSWELRYADMVGLITMVCIGALTVLYEYVFFTSFPPLLEMHASRSPAFGDGRSMPSMLFQSAFPLNSARILSFPPSLPPKCNTSPHDCVHLLSRLAQASSCGVLALCTTASPYPISHFLAHFSRPHQKIRYEKSGAPPEQHESAELADHDVDRITEEADEETTAEVNSFMVTGAIFQSRQQRVNGGGAQRIV